MMDSTDLLHLFKVNNIHRLACDLSVTQPHVLGEFQVELHLTCTTIDELVHLLTEAPTGALVEVSGTTVRTEVMHGVWTVLDVAAIGADAVADLVNNRDRAMWSEIEEDGSPF